MWRSAFSHHKNWSWQAANPIQKTSWVLNDVLICSQTTREHKIDELNRMEYLCCKSQIGIKEGFDCPNIFPIVIKQISLQACSVRSLTAEMRTIQFPVSSTFGSSLTSHAVHGQLTTKWSKRQEFIWLLQHYLCLIPACSILWLIQELSQNQSHWL